MKWRDLQRVVPMLGIPAVIIWLGGDAIAHIRELYDGLCPVQGSGMARLLYTDNPQGYCTGIGDDLWILGFIMSVAAITVISTLVMWWERRKEA